MKSHAPQCGALRWLKFKDCAADLPAHRSAAHSAACGAFGLRGALGRRWRRRASSAWPRRCGLGAAWRALAAGCLAGRALAARGRAAAALGAGVDQRGRLVERDRLRRLVVRQVGVDAVVADVGAVAAVLGDDRAALLRMLAELPAGIGAEAAALAGIGLLLLDQRDRAVEPDGEDVVARRRGWRRSCRASRRARSGRRRR